MNKSRLISLINFSALLLAQSVPLFQALPSAAAPVLSHFSPAQSSQHTLINSTQVSHSNSTPALQHRNGGNSQVPGTGLNLSSIIHNNSVGSSLNSRIVDIKVGGTQLAVNGSTLITAAERMAVMQVMQSGHQSLLLNARGSASGGTLLIGSNLVSQPSGLVIPKGVTVTDLTSSGILNLSGNLFDSGKLYLASSNPTLTAYSVTAKNITVGSNGLLSSIVPASAYASAAPGNANLSLTASNNISNSGTISSGGTLSLFAGGSITNAMPQGKIGAPPLIQAVNNVNLASASGHITNSGSIISSNGSINILNPTSGADLIIYAGGGTFQALKGDINVRDASYTGSSNILLNGGNYLSQNLNLYSGSGAINAITGQVSGNLNSHAGVEHFAADTKLLILRDNTISGDPTFVNTGGSIFISGTNSFGENVAILAAGDISAAVDGSIVDNGFSVTLVAGAGLSIAGTGGVSNPFAILLAGSGVPPSLILAPGDVVTVNFSTSASGVTPAGTGGNIDLSASSSAIVIDTSSLPGSGTIGGNVTLAAFANGNTGGNIKLNPTSTINTYGDGPAAGGNVNIYAGASPSTSTNTIQVGNITTGGAGAGGNGSLFGAVNIVTAQPTASGGVTTVTFDSTGTIGPGQSIGSSSAISANAGIIAGTITTAGAGGRGGDLGTNALNGGAGGNVTISAGDTLSAGSIETFGGGGGAGWFNTNAGSGGRGGKASMTIYGGHFTGEVNSSGGGGGGAGAGGTAGAGGDAGDITIVSGGPLLISGAVLAASGGDGASSISGTGGGGGGGSFGGGGGGFVGSGGGSGTFGGGGGGGGSFIGGGGGGGGWDGAGGGGGGAGVTVHGAAGAGGAGGGAGGFGSVILVGASGGGGGGGGNGSNAGGDAAGSGGAGGDGGQGGSGGQGNGSLGGTGSSPAGAGGNSGSLNRLFGQGPDLTITEQAGGSVLAHAGNVQLTGTTVTVSGVFNTGGVFDGQSINAQGKNGSVTITSTNGSISPTSIASPVISLAATNGSIGTVGLPLLTQASQMLVVSTVGSGASGNVFLSNNSGSLSPVALSISALAASVNVSNVGSVVLQDFSSLTNTAGGGTFSLSVAPDSAGNGTIFIGGNVSASSAISFTANSAGSGVGGIQNTNGGGQLTAHIVNLVDIGRSTSPGAGDIGNQSSAIRTAAINISASTGGNAFLSNDGGGNQVTLTANSSTGSVTVTNVGNVVLGSISTAFADFSLSTTADLAGNGQISISGIVNAPTINLHSTETGTGTGGIIGNGLIIGSALNLLDDGGPIGTNAHSPLNIAVASLVVDTEASAFISNTGSLSLLASSVGSGKTFSLSTIPDTAGNGQITINGNISAGASGSGGTIILNSSESVNGSGGIASTSGSGQLPNLIADTVILIDGNSGSGSGNIGTVTSKIGTQTSNLSVETCGNGFVSDSSGGIVTITGLNSAAQFNLTATGSITVPSSGTLQAHSISLTGSPTGTLLLFRSLEALPDASGNGGSLSIKIGSTLNSSNGTIRIDADATGNGDGGTVSINTNGISNQNISEAEVISANGSGSGQGGIVSLDGNSSWFLAPGNGIITIEACYWKY